MFFNLGMPADTAASHGHEFSPKHGARMASENSGYQHSYLQPLHYLHEKLLAFTGAEAPLASSNGEASRSETGASSNKPRLVSDRESIASEARRPSVAKKRTIYQMAHPIHKHTTRTVLRRSPMLLQLRQLEAARRAPTPVLEIFMKRSTSRPVTRSHSKKSTSRRLSAKGHSHERLVFVTCDSYEDGEGTDDLTEDEVDHRETIASISIGGDHETVIKIGEEQWTVSSLSNGGYEFSHSDDNGNVNKARWVPKPVAQRRPILDVQIDALQKPSSDRQFRFVLVHSNGRKHPIVGSMDCNAIEVRDQFVVPDTPASTPDPCSPARLNAAEPSYHASYFNSPPLAANGIVTTSDHTRLLMLVTGVWIAVVEGWTHYGNFATDSGDLASQLSASPQKLRAPSPNPSVHQEKRSETPRSFTSNISQAFAGRRHRHTATTGSIPIVNPHDAGTVPMSGNSVLSLVPSSISDTRARSTATSNENVDSGCNQPPSPSASGLGIDTCGNSTSAHSIVEEPTSPSSSGFQELLGKLHISSKRDERKNFDISEGGTQDLVRRGSKSSSKMGHSKKKSEDLGKRTRRLLGLGKSRAAS